MTRLPDFVVLGQGKAGTSLIYRTLAAMPDIGLSTPKELHYFSANYGKGRGWYARHFADVDPGVAAVGEVSPSYLRPVNVERVAETLGTSTKVIFVLRKPIEQNYARYLQNICATQDAPSFHVRVRPMPSRLARLEEAIALALTRFGEANVLPLIFERDIAVERPSYSAKIRSFLGLPRIDESAPAGPINPSVMPRYLYGGPDGFRITAGDGAAYWVPKRRLIFCAQDRNSRVWPDASAESVADALARQSQWSTEVSTSEYASLQEAHVIPAADRLQERFGLSVDHWREEPPRRISYPLAPPPPQFRSRDGGTA